LLFVDIWLPEFATNRDKRQIETQRISYHPVRHRQFGAWQMDTILDRIITAPVGEFCRLSGLGKTKVYEPLATVRSSRLRSASVD
jgi:hypothetical protein